MPFLADLLVALGAALVTFLAARWYTASPTTTDHPAEDVARAVGEAAGSHPASRGFVARRLDRTAVTGLLLTTALAVTFLGALLLGVLALLVRRVASIQHVDNSVAAWGYDHRSAASTHALRWVTDLGSIRIVVGLALVLVLVDLARHRNRWAFLFLLVVLVGMEISMLSVKALVGRLRPTLTPEAATLGPSFPSGHSATAAAFYAAAALIIGRGLSGRWRHLRDRGRRRAGGRRRREPCAARPPLALRRHRRPRARLGLVRTLRRRLRRPDAPADGRCRSRRGRSRDDLARRQPAGHTN